MTLFIEHPLHIHVLLAQSRADLWIRNGFSVINQVYLYRGSYFMESFNADVMLMQAGLVLLGNALRLKRKVFDCFFLRSRSFL